MHVQENVISGKCTFREMCIRANVVSAKCFSGKCNFWKVFFGELYRIPLKMQKLQPKMFILTAIHVIVLENPLDINFFQKLFC